MEEWLTVDWKGIFGFSMPVMELVIRGSAIYWFLFLVFRFVVRRDIGSVGIADILILVIVADASQNAMAGEYNTISEGMVLISTLIFWNVMLDWASFNFPWVRRFAEPRSLILVQDGHIQIRNLRKEFLTEEELWAKLRQNGVESLDQVKRAFLEADGEFSVIKKKE